MKRIVKIAGEAGSGKTELLSMIAAGSPGRNYIQIFGDGTVSGILQSLRGRSDVVVLIDGCSPALMAELEAIVEGSSIWNRISQVYAVVSEVAPPLLPVKAPALPQKPIRLAPPRLEALEREEAVTAALAKRDREWNLAIQAAGGGVV